MSKCNNVKNISMFVISDEPNTPGFTIYIYSLFIHMGDMYLGALLFVKGPVMNYGGTHTNIFLLTIPVFCAYMAWDSLPCKCMGPGYVTRCQGFSGACTHWYP